MKYKDLLQLCHKLPASCNNKVVSAYCVDEDDIKCPLHISHGMVQDGKFVFLTDSSLDGKKILLKDLTTQLQSRLAQYSDLECFAKCETSDVVVPIVDVAHDDHAFFNADFTDFDKTDKKIERVLLFKSAYSTLQDAKRDLKLVIDKMGLEYVRSYKLYATKNSHGRIEIDVKLRGTATKLYEFKHSSSLMHVDKRTYEAFTRKRWESIKL